jgi:4a-hydroxytetrahydrobiopterin dehydratase
MPPIVETPLVQETCRPCEKESPPLGEADVAQLFKELKGWSIERPEGGEPRLVKAYTFTGFRRAVAFVSFLALRADEANHHPTVLLELKDGGVATVSWWTHHMGALNRNDFIMAAKTDELYASPFWEI